MTSIMANTGQSRQPAPLNGQQDPFSTPGPFNAAKFADLDNDSPTAYTSDSPMHAKRVLEAHIADLDRRIKQASKLGTSLVDHRKELSHQLTEVENHKDADEMGPDLKRKLLELEREYNDIGKESARSFIPRSRYVSNEVGATPSPAKMQVPTHMRKQRPQSVDNFSEFAADLSTQLVQQVRDLQTQLRAKDEQVRESNNQIIRLQGEIEGFHYRMRSVDDDEEKFKDANWNLETRLQEVEAQLKDVQQSEERLKKTLHSTKAEKLATEREFEELKATHYQLTDDHSVVQKQHETDVSGLRRTVDAREKEQELMQRKIDELTTQNQELAKAVAWRVRSDTESGAEEYESAPQPEDAGRSSPDGSPPASPSKATPARHGVLEHETMRSSLAHLQKRYQALQNNIHREKTEKIELRRLLQDARDELERRDKDSGLGSNSTKRPKSSNTASFKKPTHPNKLGGAKLASEEIWEDFEDNSLRRSVIHHRSQPSTDASDAYATANENETDSWATANEKDTTTDSEAFATGVESMPNSSDELTETEDGPSNKRVVRMPSTASNLRRQSFLSTASASDDDNDAYDVATPTSNTQRYRTARLNRSGTYRASPNMRDSPASFVSNTSGPRSNVNLAAELEDLDTSSIATSTPSRSIASRDASPRLDAAPPIPPMPSSIFRTETKDSGTLTDTHGSPKAEQDEFSSKGTAALGGGVIGGIAGALFGSGSSKKAEEQGLSQATSKELSDDQTPTTSAASAAQPSQAELDEMIEKRVRERIAEIEAAKPAPVFPPSPKVNVDQLVSERVAQQVEAFKASQPKSLSQGEIDALVAERAQTLAQQAKPKQAEIDALVETRAKALAEQAKPKQHEIDALIAAQAAQLAEQQKPKQHEIDALVAAQAAQLAERQKPKQADIDALVATKARELAEQSKPKQAEIDALVAAKAKELAEQSKPKQAEIDALIAAKAQELAALNKPHQSEIDALVAAKARELSERSDALVEARAKELAAARAPPTPQGPSQAEIDALIESRAQVLAAARAPPTPKGPSQAEINALVEERARALATAEAKEAARGADPKANTSKATPTHVAFSQLLSKSYSREGTPVSNIDSRASSPEEDTAGNKQLVSPLQRNVEGVEDPFSESPLSSARSSALSENLNQPHYSLPSSIGQDSRHPASLTPSDFSSAASVATLAVAARATTDEGTQTSVSSEQIDSLIKERNRRADTVAPSSPRAASHRNSPNVSKLPEGVFIRRPGSQSSIRTAETTKQVPPLPADHREAIAAANRNSSVGPAHAPPPVPKANPLRQRTYSQSSATRGSTRRRDPSAIRVGQDPSRRSSISSFASEVEGRFDMQRPVYPDAYGGESTDPRMIAAITQTMIGEFMWKYTRKAGRAEHSENRHRRFFWIHPYTRTLYWSTQDPSHAGKDELKAKSVAIEAVRVVGDDNPLPPGLHTKSLVIVTPGRSIKLTASTSGRHETWFNALSYLLLRGNEQPPAENVYSNVHRGRSSTVNSHQSEDMGEYDPYGRPGSALTHRSNQSLAARYASAPQPRLTKTPSVNRRNTAQRITPNATPSVSGHSTGTSTPVRHAPEEQRAGEFGEFKKPRPPSIAVTPSKTDDKKTGLGNRLSNLSFTNLTRRGRAASRAADEDRRRQEEQLSMPLPSPRGIEFAHQQGHHHHHHGGGSGGNVENVRACCDGKHDVASLPYRSSSRSASVASNSRNSFSIRGSIRGRSEAR